MGKVCFSFRDVYGFAVLINMSNEIVIYHRDMISTSVYGHA